MIGVINDHKFTIVYEWSQQCSQHQNLYRMEPIILKFYNIDWVRRLQGQISTIMRDWCLQWLQNYHFNELSQQWYQYQHSWRSKVTHILESRILNEWSRQWSQHPDSLRNSIILTELEDYRHEYLRLWMIEVFNDQNFTSMNEGSQQCSQHQDCLRKEPIITQHSIILTELEDYREKVSTIMRECIREFNQYWLS